jgi:DNA-binding transcriptional LysR family regulator
MDLSLYLSSPHIGVSSRRTGLLLEDIYLNRQQLSRQIFLRCQHYATALQVLAQYPKAILTIPQSILKHLHYSDNLHIHALPIELPRINMGMYWHEQVKHNSRHQFLRTEILKIFA